MYELENQHLVCGKNCVLNVLAAWKVGLKVNIV